ncbi:MAG: hypothetical protein IPJ77_12880 [Planctomycetes bacterium]|nr:hypothetical protein [Planctomycetota bacterium]
MSVQVETQSQLQDFLGVLRRRKWQILLPAAFVIALGGAFAVVVPKKYVVKTQVELRPVGVSVSSKDGANATFQIRARERVKKVVGELRNERYLTLPPDERNEFLVDIVDDVKVRLDRAGDGVTSFVNIEYSSVDPLWARTFLKALRDDWINDVVQRDRNKLGDEKQKLFEEKQKLERQLLREEEAVTELKRKHGISATQSVPGTDGQRSEDPIYAALVANRAEASRLDRELERAKVERETLQARLDELPEMLSAEEQVVAGTSNAAELDALDGQIRDLQKALREYRPEHPKFQRIKFELEELLEQREQTTHITARSEVVSTPKPNPAREPLQKQIDDIDLRIATGTASRASLAKAIQDDERRSAELHSVYEELRVKATLIGNLRENLSATDRRYNSKAQDLELVEGPLGNPFSITEEVVPPPRPTEPNPMLIVAGAVVGGLALGLALAVMLEFSRNCFRSVHELSRVLVVPVLGRVDTILTRRDVRLIAARRVLVGVSSILLLASVLFVTWAWAKSPELLSPTVREKIELFRSKFR